MSDIIISLSIECSMELKNTETTVQVFQGLKKQPSIVDGMMHPEAPLKICIH